MRVRQNPRLAAAKYLSMVLPVAAFATTMGLTAWANDAAMVRHEQISSSIGYPIHRHYTGGQRAATRSSVAVARTKACESWKEICVVSTNFFNLKGLPRGWDIDTAAVALDKTVGLYFKSEVFFLKKYYPALLRLLGLRAARTDVVAQLTAGSHVPRHATVRFARAVEAEIHVRLFVRVYQAANDARLALSLKRQDAGENLLILINLGALSNDYLQMLDWIRFQGGAISVAVNGKTVFQSMEKPSSGQFEAFTIGNHGDATFSILKVEISSAAQHTTGRSE